MTNPRTLTFPVLNEVKRMFRKCIGKPLTDDDRAMAEQFDVVKEIEKAKAIRMENEMSKIKPVFYVDANTLRCRTMDDISEESVLYYRRGDKVNETDVALYSESAIEALQKENAELKEELDRERMRLTACGVAALENTKDCVDKRISKDSPYYSGSYSSICRAVDEEIRLRDENAAQAKRIEEAVSRIKDMLINDDGQAHKEARKFLERVEASQAQQQTISVTVTKWCRKTLFFGVL